MEGPARTRGHAGESEDASVYLTRLVLENVRAFEKLDLPFTGSGVQPRMTNIIIGRNGTGKSTLLRCIVLGLASQAQANALRAEDLGASFVGPKDASAKIRIELAELDGSNPTVLCKRITKQGDSEVLSSEEGEEGEGTLARWSVPTEQEEPQLLAKTPAAARSWKPLTRSSIMSNRSTALN